MFKSLFSRRARIEAVAEIGAAEVDADVRPRDTDADWEEIGRTNPYFGVLADPRFKTENLTEEARTEFFQTGEGDVRSLMERFRQRYPDFAPTSALDFGCGVGRVTRALAAATGDAFGVDISESMLAEARRTPIVGAAFGQDIPDRLFDWVLSVIVFQHIPPERGYALLRELMKRLAPGGFVTLQFALYRDPALAAAPGGRVLMVEGLPVITNDAALNALPKGEMVMFDYDLTVIAAILFSAGVVDFELTHTDHGGFHGATLYGRRAPG
ncbi:MULTISPECIES: class I SAM-dependent methyltransferase [unclassified Brevundimonas]|uniref:class I SAM-dependent methyltransferase n=1 Tax=unclassified Brevundimonas TaxID=2622653 RepID=UPI0025C3D485|nr:MULTISPECIES: class I SAM-dependent methyltransferase [unclassified Brevundimonas]